MKYNKIHTQKLSAFLVVIMATWFISGCQDGGSTFDTPVGGFEIIRENGEISIKDQIGKIWNITYAVNEYGFDPQKFEHGLGPTAILPISDPQFLSPGQPGYPAQANDFLVIGYHQDNIIRAYSLNILVHHEIVNENYNGQSVVVAYCPLANLTAIYNRQIFEAALTLGASGWTYNDTFIIFDLETESLWYPLPGKSGLTCINGQYADTHLPEIASTQSRWAEWKNENPSTLYLKEPE